MLFAVSPLTPQAGLYVANADGTEVTHLPQPSDLLMLALQPDWSPDASQIVFSAFSGTNTTEGAIWLINADGSDPRRLTQSGHAPPWSPDGAQIAYHDRLEIWLLELATGDAQLFTDGRNPVWRPLPPP